MQHKAENHARKFRKQAKLLGQAQKDRDDWEGITKYHRQLWVKGANMARGGVNSLFKKNCTNSLEQEVSK